MDIDSLKKLEAWLQDKPRGWASVIAHRAALRVLPIALNPAHAKVPSLHLPLTCALLRASVIPRIKATNLSGKFAASDAADAVYSAMFTSADIASKGAAHATANAADAAAVTAALPANNAAKAAACAIDAAAVTAAFPANRSSTRADGAASAWKLIRYDCNSLARGLRLVTLLERPVWASVVPARMQREISAMESHLLSLGQDFDLWIEWYRRRVVGDTSGFGLPPGPEEELSRRLIEATDDWWKREPALVNGNIKSWIDELTPVAEPIEGAFAQNPFTENFLADEEGRIGIAPPLPQNGLINDEDACRFHEECRREIESAIVASGIGLTQATDVLRPLQSLLEAVGEAIESANPQALVTRLEKVRTLYNLRDASDDMATPFTVTQKIEISSALKIGDAWVAFDAKLATIRDGTYGPDYPRTSVDPQTVRIIIEQAKSMGVARDDAHALIIDASTDVPAGAPKDDRRRITLGARFGNFIRATGRFIWTHKGKIAAGSVTGLGMAIGFINKNAAMLTEMFASSPTLVEIIKWIGKLAL